MLKMSFVLMFQVFFSGEKNYRQCDSCIKSREISYTSLIQRPVKYYYNHRNSNAKFLC